MEPQHEMSGFSPIRDWGEVMRQHADNIHKAQRDQGQENHEAGEPPHAPSAGDRPQLDPTGSEHGANSEHRDRDADRPQSSLSFFFEVAGSKMNSHMRERFSTWMACKGQSLDEITERKDKERTE